MLLRHVLRAARQKLFPEAIVRPILDFVVEVALHIVAAEHRTALRGERKTAAVIAIADVGIGRRFRHDAEPAERITLVVGLEHVGRDRGAADAVIAVAAGDIVAVDAHACAVFLVGHERPRRCQVVQLHVGGLVDDNAAGFVAGGKQIFGDGGLAVGHHRLAGIFPRVDQKARPVFPGDPRAVVQMPLAVHALAEPDLAQERDGAGLEHAGANPLQHVGAGLPLQHDRFDAVAIENVREQQTGGAGADDDDLGAHDALISCSYPPPCKRGRGTLRQRRGGGGAGRNETLATKAKRRESDGPLHHASHCPPPPLSRGRKE